MRALGGLILIAVGGCAVHQAPIGEIDEGLSVCAKGPVVNGVDVSHWDGAIDWAKVKAGGIDFAIMKATETTDFVDATFATNWKAAADAGVIRGAYHFFRSNIDGVAQADFFLKTIGPSLDGDLPPTLDLETLDGASATVAGQAALAFLARVQQVTGRTPIVYTSASFLSSINSPPGFSAYTLWVANWQVTCPKIPSPPWSDWTIWQSSSTTTVPGINVKVDYNQFNGTLDDLQTLAGKAPADPPDAGPARDGGVDDGGGEHGGGQDAGDSADGAADPDPLTSGGCSMATSGTRGPASLLALMLALGLMMVRNRRRLRR